MLDQQKTGITVIKKDSSSFITKKATLVNLTKVALEV